MWIAVLFGAMLALGVGAYAAWAAHAVMNGAALWPFVVGFPFAYLAFPLLITAFWMFLGWRWRSPRPQDVALAPRETLSLFWEEWKSIAQAPKMIVYGLLMPDPAPAPAALPVLLVHGIGCNAAVWTSMRRHLEREALGPVYALSYGPPFASIETFAPQVAAKLAQIEHETGASQVVMVCHSMGGLVARSYIRRYGGAHVRRLVTIGTPHAGSRHARLMRGDSLTQMRPGSAYLAALEERHDHEAGVPSVSLWSWHDSMVTPQTSSHVDWMHNIVVDGIAHNALLGDVTVQRYVAAEIRRARAGVPTNEFPASTGQRPSARA